MCKQHFQGILSATRFFVRSQKRGQVSSHRPSLLLAGVPSTPVHTCRMSCLQSFPDCKAGGDLNGLRQAYEKIFSSISYQSVQLVAQSCLTLCDPTNCSMPGLPVHHQLPEFTQTHVHRVSDAIQPSHPLSSPSPPAPNPSQHQGLFQ